MKTGILSRATDAATKTQLAEAEESANLIYMDLIMGSYQGGSTDTTLADIASKLTEKGYKIEQKSSSGNITGITLNPSTISVPVNGTATITVTYEGGEDLAYYVVIKGEYYKMTLDDNGVSIEKTPTEVDGGTDTNELGATSDNSSVTVESISGNEITLKGGSSTGSATITVTYGSLSETCTASVVILPSESDTPNTSVSFSTAYGRIDVIWLDTSNNVISTPNTPNLGNETTGTLTPVKWVNSEPTPTNASDSDWYNYKAGTGTADNLESKWANATNDDGSYFVWIPRYAYRITYYESQTSDTPTGYYDGYGMWKATDGSKKYDLDEGIETVDYNGNKYIVHPAFMKDTGKTDSEGNDLDDYARGGWSSNLSGIWVAKFEMSYSNATISSSGSGSTFKSVPSVISARSITIGNMYTYGKAYASEKESHLMKNSEWGAVAYLTQSQYGRNGNEISVNQCSSYITGAGRGLNSTEDSSFSGTSTICNSTYASSALTDRQKYTGDVGKLSSTTGNEYGVYDLSGGAWEYVAAFNDTDSNGYESTYGSSFAAIDNPSTQYATKYSNAATSSSSTDRYAVGKIGDATKEVYAGSNNWFGDYSYFLNASNPFFKRGGNYSNGSNAGSFCSYYDGGYSNNYYGFRVVLGL